jgi:anti-sigma-K factor RskA
MKDEKPDFGELEADLADLAEPVAPPPQLKSSIMDAIASGEYPQVAPGAKAGEDNVVPLSKTRGTRRGFARTAFAAAAAVVLLAGVGIVGTTSGLWGDGENADLAENNTNQSVEGGGEDAPEVFSDDESAGQGANSEEPMQGAEAEDHMHSIMAMGDVRSVSLKAEGSTLDVVVSAEMDSGGAMVNGAPVLKDGMGAQVWSINESGAARSAGVIGQDPHDNVWMPLPADTMMVRVTEEPMDGSDTPGGTVLAEGKL